MEPNRESLTNGNVVSAKNSFSRWGVFLTLAVTYFLIYSQRTAPGLITDQLMQQFRITASTLGLLAGIQYFAYMCLQIPLGIWADRVGPDRLLMLGTLLDGIGTMVYSLAPNSGVLMGARLLVGVGDAMIWINIVLVLGRYFRTEEFAGVLGWMGMSGSLGTFVTTVPLTYWITAAGWRIPFFSLGSALIGCVVLLYVVLVRRSRRVMAVSPTTVGGKSTATKAAAPREGVGQVLKRLVRTRQAWATFFCHFGLVGTYIAFIGSWAVPYLMTVYGVTRATASGLVSLGLIGALVGGPVTGMIVKRLQGEKAFFVGLHVMTFLCWMLIFLMGGKPPLNLMMVLFVLIGFGNGGSMLTFAIVRKWFPQSESGVASGFANTGGFLSAVILPSLFGLVLEHFGVSADSVSSHTVEVAYQWSFLVPAVFSVLGIIGGLAIEEKRSKAMRGTHSLGV